MKFLLAILLFIPSLSFAAFPTVNILDDFNRANVGPPPSSKWSQYLSKSQWKVSGNVIVPQTAGSYNDIWNYWNATKFGPDVEAYVTASNMASLGDGYIWVWVRLDVVNANGYAAYVSKLDAGGIIRIYRLTSGSRTSLASTAITPANGDSIGIKVYGSTIELWYRVGSGAWTLKNTVVDTTYPNAGYMAVQGQDVADAEQADNFGGGSTSPTITNFYSAKLYQTNIY